jgi:predicted lipid-binding transport protein (Tim44 family)
MKSCPTCNRTFEDSFTFCLIDGAVLSAPFDPAATKRIPEARITKAPPTEVLPSDLRVRLEELPPTVPSPLLAPTMPRVPLEYSPARDKRAAVDKVTQKQESLGWILGGLTVGLMLGVIIGLSLEDPKGAVPLGLLGLLLGAVIGKLISRTIQKDSE